MSAPRKYELTDETKVVFGVTLHRIRALVAIAAIGVAAGDLGGFVQYERNLGQSDRAWVSGNAHVFGDAHVSGNASVSGDASVSGNARVFGNARVSGDARVFGNASVSGDAHVFGNASVFGVNVIATRTDGYTFLIAPTPSGPRIMAGCRYFSIDEARAHWAATRGGTKLGDESLALVDHLERMAILNGFMEPVAVEAGK